MFVHSYYLFFFFNDTATTEIYTLSLHDALPISLGRVLPQELPEVAPNLRPWQWVLLHWVLAIQNYTLPRPLARSEEHTSELQSRQYLVCRLLLEKKKKKKCNTATIYEDIFV